MGDDLTLAFFGEDSSKESTTLVAGEAFFPQRQRDRERRRTRTVEPSRRVFERGLPAFVLNELANELVVEINI